MKSRLAFALVVAALAGCGDEAPLKPAPQGPTDAAGTVTALGEIYEARSLAAFTAMLSEDFVFLRDFADPETGAVQWNAAEELAVHARMFEPGSIPASDIPLDASLWLEVMDVTLTPLIAFAERPDLYTSANPQGALDSNRWIARGATYQTSAFFNLRGDTDYQVEGRAYFVVLEDRTKQVGEAGKFLLYRWEDRGQVRVGADAPAVEPHSWSAVKSIYRRGRVAPLGAAELIDHLAQSYRTRNLMHFSTILAPGFRFTFDQPNPTTGETDWGIDEEYEVHRRMFTPNDQPPVPADLFVQDIRITLSPETSFIERRDLYTTSNPPGPLNPSQWIARGAIYGTNVFFQLAGETDYQVTGRADFVVLENRNLQPGHPAKFLLYRWGDLGMTAAGREARTSGVEAASWSGMKQLYRIPENLPPGDAPALIEGLASAYRRRDYAAFETLLSPDFLFILDMPNPDTGETLWNWITENGIHRRMFDPQNIPPGDPPLDSAYWLQSVSITLTPEATFVERPDLYTTSDPPGPLDPTHWRAEAATYGTDVFFQLQGDTDFHVTGRAYFTVITDLTKNIGDPGKFLILRWEDLGMTAAGRGARTSGVEQASWSGIKQLYRVQESSPGDAPALIEGLANAYLQQNYGAFEALLAPDFLFFLDMPNPDTGEWQWDRTTENRIHRRMFDPENIPPGDPPLDSAYWLQSVNVTLTPEATFVERPDLYTTFDPPGPLDPTHWKAEAATYGTNVFFQLQGDTDFQVTGRAYFTVIEDLSKQIGDPGKWLIYRWEDLGMTNSIATESGTWGSVKSLYN